MVQRLPGPLAKMCAGTTIVQYIFCGGHHSGSVEVLVIVSDLVYLDDAPRDEDGMPREERTLEMVRRVVWWMPYADDAGMVWISPRGLTGMMDTNVVAYQEFELTVSEKKTKVMHLWSDPSTSSNALRIEAEEQRYKQKSSLYTLVVLSARARTLTPKVRVDLAPLG